MPGAVTTFPTEDYGPATVLGLSVRAEALDFSYRPIVLRWQHDETAVALDRHLTITEATELRDTLARMSVAEVGAPSSITVIGDEMSDAAIVLVHGERDAPLDAPRPVHLQLDYDPHQTPVRRLLTAAAAAELLRTLTALLDVAPRSVPASLRTPRWWARTVDQA